MCGTGSSILLGFVNAREVGVSSRNLVSRTFPQIFQSMLTPMSIQPTRLPINVFDPVRRHHQLCYRMRSDSSSICVANHQ